MTEENVFLNSQVLSLFGLVCGVFFRLFEGFAWFVVVAGFCYLLIFSLSLSTNLWSFPRKGSLFPSTVCYFISVA